MRKSILIGMSALIIMGIISGCNIKEEQNLNETVIEADVSDTTGVNTSSDEIAEDSESIQETSDTGNEEIGANTVLPSYETALRETVTTIEEQLKENTSIDDLKLPAYIRVLDSCEGDIGDNLNKDKVIVLEFTDDYPDELMEESTLNPERRVICVFGENGLGEWKCIARNNILLHKTDADIYRDVVIENGKMIVSIAGNTPCNWNNTYQFGLGRMEDKLYLERIEDWQSDLETGEGFYAVYDYDTGVITYQHIKEHQKENITDLYRVAMFPTDSFGGPAMEEVEASEVLAAKPSEFFLEDEKVLKAMQESIVLEDATELEFFEWIGENNRCLRVGICYEEDPENKYIHKEDYYFFLDDNGNIEQVLHEDYEDIHIGSGCDFIAHFEDVTFDGKEDLIVSIGDGRYERYFTAYVYENGQYVYKKSFEQIPTYQVDQNAKVITGVRGPAHNSTYYTFGYENGEFVVLTEK